MSTRVSLWGKRSGVTMGEDTDPLDPVETDDMYNRYQTEDTEGYPEVPLHLGDGGKPHQQVTGIDTFYGMDHAQPSQSEKDDGTLIDTAPSGIEAVRDGLEMMQRDAAADTSEHRVRVNTNSSGDWTASTFAIDNTRAYPIVPARTRRGDSVICNWSIADVYVSHHSPPDVTGGATPDVVKVPPNGARTVRTEKEIWCRGTTAQAQIVDVQTEYN